MTTKKLRYAMYLTAIQAAMHIYDFTLHFEDLDIVPYSVLWQAPHEASSGLQLFEYTPWWSTYWGFASVLSLLTLCLLFMEVRENRD